MMIKSWKIVVYWPHFHLKVNTAKILFNKIGFDSTSVCCLSTRRVSQLIEYNARKKSSNSKPYVAVDPQTAKCDFVGPPHKIANIRSYKYYKPENESSLEALYRQKRQQTTEWHIKFWSDHNSSFRKEKEEFIKNKLLEKYGNRIDQTESKYISAEEMATFYKSYLDKNLMTHINYNNEWYKKNLENLILSVRVVLQNLIKKFLKRPS